MVSEKLLTMVVDGVTIVSTRAVKMIGWRWWSITKGFTNIQLAKQTRIINVALEEFARYGYKQASTNRIVKKAGIGKGMLFYYFKSKKELFYYLIDYGINFVLKEYIDRLDEKETDFIERYKQAAQTKMKAYAKNPHVFNFLGALYLSNEDELPKELHNRLVATRDRGLKKLFTNFDTSLFREDVPKETVYKVIHWALDGYQNELIESLRGKDLNSINFDPYWDDFNNFLAVLKRVFYKPEEVGDGNPKSK